MIEQVPGGDLCFYLACSQVAPAEILNRFERNLVVHESDLPLGRGWSPLSWPIIEGASDIAVTLFEAEPSVDSGVIYAQEWLHFDGTELLRDEQAVATINLCRNFIAEYPASVVRGLQQLAPESRYRRRTRADSALDPDVPLAEQFDLLRVVDYERHPATLELREGKYRIFSERTTD